MRIAVIGKGNVGTALAPSFNSAGHEVAFGVRDPADAKHVDDDIPSQSCGDAARWAEVVVLAVNWDQVDDALAACGDISGKILIDCTNPLSFSDEGIALVLGFHTSGGEIIAAKTRAKLIKTLNHVGSPVMATAHDYARRPIQFVCGDDDDARQQISGLLRDIGFEPVDYGGIENACKTEPLAMLWIDQVSRHGTSLANAFTFTRPGN